MALVFPYIWIPSGGVGPVEIVPWNRGTDEQIKAMIDAADAGEIALADYWSVGNERIVHLSAIPANPNGAFITAMDEQDVVLVLMNEGYPGEGNEGVNFVWGQKDCLSQSGRMYKDATYEHTWADSSMRIDLNNLYYGALPATFRSCLKPFNVITAQNRKNPTIQVTQDYISLFAEREVFSNGFRSCSVEINALSQIEYYKTSENKNKQCPNDNDWWNRSPRTGNSSYNIYRTYFTVARKASASSASQYTTLLFAESDDRTQNQSSGIAPFGCI